MKESTPFSDRTAPTDHRDDLTPRRFRRPIAKISGPIGPTQLASLAIRSLRSLYARCARLKPRERASQRANSLQHVASLRPRCGLRHRQSARVSAATDYVLLGGHHQ